MAKTLEKCFKEGEVIKVGQTIAIIETSATSEQNISTEIVSKEEPKEAVEEISAKIEKSIEAVKKIVQTPINTTEASRFYSPLVKNIALTEGITLDELEKIVGTGNDGRVTKHDLVNYIDKKQTVDSI